MTQKIINKMNAAVSIILWLLLFDTCLMMFGTLAQGRKKPGLVNSRRKRPNKQERARQKTILAKSTSAVVDKLLHHYNRQEPPMEDKPTEVRIGIYIISFYSVSEQFMDFTLSMYLKLNWRDPRLKFDPVGGRIHSIRLGDGRWDQIWSPDIFFRNEKRSALHDILKPNRLLKLNSTGFLWYVTKISTSLSCNMNLRNYPLDIQYCSIMFESFGNTMDTMYFSWLDFPVDVDPSVELPQHELAGKILYDCSTNYTGGAWPCHEIRFVLKRDIGYYLMQVYMPSCLIVVLSWVTFWIRIDKIAERVSVGLVIILTMTTWNTGIQSSLPRVSYIKGVNQVCFVIFILLFFRPGPMTAVAFRIRFL